MKYEYAPELKEKVKQVISRLGLNHIRVDDVECIRSVGSTSNAIARIHALGKVMQLALKRDALYVIEFIHERFDKMSEEDKIKTIIHELMHIPKSFGGGFKFHDYVCEKNVGVLYRRYLMGEANNIKFEQEDIEKELNKKKGFSFW